MKNVNKGEVIKEISSKDKIIYQEDIEKNNYYINLKKSELNDILLALNIIITDIKNNINKIYIINEIENIITKLKKSDIPPTRDFTSVPTFSTVDVKEDYNDENKELDNNSYDKKSSYSPLIPGLSNSKIDNKTYVTNVTNCNINDPNQSREKYEGPLINGKKEGKGKYIYQNGCKYEGYFKNDKKDGNGIFYYSNGDRYKGNFQDGNYQGFGVFYFNNGDRYEGEFNKNKYYGKGKYFYHNGDRFEGQWLNDKKHGQGVYIYLNGDKIVGNYNAGKPFGNHIKYSNNGEIFQINYSKSK